MADKKKRACPKCGKEFEYDPDDFGGRCPSCSFNVARYDDERDLAEVRKKEDEAAEIERKKKDGDKKKSSLSNLGRL